MAKLSWNKFRETHDKGHCIVLYLDWNQKKVSQAYFKQNGLEFPKPNAVLLCLMNSAEGDWAIKGNGTERLIILSDANDCALFGSLVTEKNLNPACISTKSIRVTAKIFMSWGSPCSLF